MIKCKVVSTAADAFFFKTFLWLCDATHIISFTSSYQDQPSISQVFAIMSEKALNTDS